MKSSYVVTSWCVLDTTDDNDVCGTEPKWSEQLNLFEDVRLSLILFLDFKIRWVVIELAIGCNVFNIHRWLTIYNYSSYAIRQWHILRFQIKSKSNTQKCDSSYQNNMLNFDPAGKRFWVSWIVAIKFLRKICFDAIHIFFYLLAIYVELFK